MHQARRPWHSISPTVPLWGNYDCNFLLNSRVEACKLVKYSETPGAENKIWRYLEPSCLHHLLYYVPYLVQAETSKLAVSSQAEWLMYKITEKRLRVWLKSLYTCGKNSFKVTLLKYKNSARHKVVWPVEVGLAVQLNHPPMRVQTHSWGST